MKLGSRRPGTSTSFIDTSADEVLLRFSWGEAGLPELAFHIYDALGNLVADSGGASLVEAGVRITDAQGEILLDVPGPDQLICYRLYNCQGRLITSSDGSRTQIYGFLKMEGARLFGSRSSRAA